ncbi:MAG: recombination protein RecR [Deltaproteobacteria bacterium CG11_big_fil_rev_8_21_14_0_20_47_16]|nr:MAG: recombination protein RecR [Deltaproteobacteria bacterium CG11_big_fil_rev_8_21_14_0_20_47_16]
MPTNPIDRLTHAFSKLPGIGEKSAARLAFHVFKGDPKIAEELAQALLAIKCTTALCAHCFGITADDVCTICSDDRRNRQTICVVEEPKDMAAIEKTRAFQGIYHVLHGVLSPLDGVGPSDLRIAELVNRLEASPAVEIILATNPTVEGEATSHYIADILRPRGMRITRLASGIPMGAFLEYTDQQTLALAINRRREL